MKVHELKCIQPYFRQLEQGTKTFEFRKNDRDFKRDDILQLKQFDPEVPDYEYNGDLLFKVTSILTEFDGLPKGYCIMSLKRIEI